MATLEQILNWVIPIGIVIFFIFIFYRNPKIQEAVDLLFHKIGQLFLYSKAKIIETTTGTVESGQEIVYG